LGKQADVPAQFQTGMTEMLTDALVNSGRFVVVERAIIDKVMEEQARGESGGVAAGSAAKVGRLLGAKFLVSGAITSYNVSEKKEQTGFGPFASTTIKSSANVGLVM
ncbi:MAG: hypothetical protein HYV27_17630, partial [Candidatus Hydrogenedentes bacterium]|nr:hypothetical protein [Candidatus Hydrogenedentota bacterium]